MRPSRREQILAAAVELVGQVGLEGLSFEALATATGLSKSGIIYHFPSRHELLHAVHTHLAKAWESELEALAGAPAAGRTQSQRLRAVVLSLGRTADLPELLLLLDASRHEGFREAWAGVNERWMPDPGSTQAYLVQLAAYGLWAHDHVHHAPLDARARERLIAAALEQIPS